MTATAGYLRAADIARLTGMSLRTVRRWIADGVLPSNTVGGARLVATADLHRLLSPSPDLAEFPDSDLEQVLEIQRHNWGLGKA